MNHEPTVCMLGPKRLLPVLSCLLSWAPSAVVWADDDSLTTNSASVVTQTTIVTLGDSITKGFRQGVTKQQTFSALLESGLQKSGVDARVINRGIGGERTDQCLRRLDQIIQMKPDLVTVMYGTNDSYTDPGKTSSRIPASVYRQNLTKILSTLIDHDIQPILMTPPRFASGATDGQGRDSNISLQKFVVVCREVAQAMDVPLVDHFADWAAAETGGIDLNRWTTDRCHPNPAGHHVMVDAILPVVRDTIPTQSLAP